MTLFIFLVIYLRKIYAAETAYSKEKMKRKDMNEMWPLQLDDMVCSTLIF